MWDKDLIPNVSRRATHRHLPGVSQFVFALFSRLYPPHRAGGGKYLGIGRKKKNRMRGIIKVLEEKKRKEKENYWQVGQSLKGRTHEGRMKKKKTTTKERKIKNTNIPGKEKERERYTSLPGFGCVCVYVQRERKERGNDPLVRGGDWEEERDTRNVFLKKETTVGRSVVVSWWWWLLASRKNGTAELRA